MTSELAEIQTKIQDTNVAIARLERMMVDSPDLPSLLANMRSLQKRYKKLQGDFLAAADELGVDVCSYRLFPDETTPTLTGIVSALGGFQSLFSIVYDARRNGPKKIARLSPEVVRESSFGFAYSFSGSLGLVLTLPNERLLFQEVDTAIDEAMKTIFTMSKLAEPSEILAFAQNIGVAPIRALYKWADDHVKAGLGADIQWRRGEQVRASLLVQRPELERLKQTIDVTSDTEEVELDLTGELVGADIKSHTFHMTSGDMEYRGRFTDAIGPEHAVTLPKTYRAKVRKTTKIYYSTEKEDVFYFLLRLEPVESADL